MPNCEHFIYTTAKTDLKAGYQIVAKSDGIDNKMINGMTSHLYPLGIDPMEFTKSKSLLSLGKTHMAYSIVKNIGVGYDGRDGTIYNHTIVIEKDDFAKIECDTRIFDKYFMEDYSARGRLEQLCIQPDKMSIDFEYLKSLNVDFLSTFLFYLFKKNKIALVNTTDDDLIQNILAVVPPQIRSVPFSTLVLEPARQTKYKLIQITNKAKLMLKPNYICVNPDMDSDSKSKPAKDVCIQNIVGFIKTNNDKQLLRHHKDFEAITRQASETKRIKMSDILDEEKCKNFAERNEFNLLFKYVRSLYADHTFNLASTRIILQITQKIRRIVKRSLKRYETGNLEEKDRERLLSIAGIMLDCLNYINQLSEKKMSDTTKDGIEKEIANIELISKQPVKKDLPPQDYVPDPYVHLKTMCDAMSCSAFSVLLYILGRK